MKLECQELLNNMLINDWRGIKENLIMKKNNENLSAMSDISHFKTDVFNGEIYKKNI